MHNMRVLVVFRSRRLVRLISFVKFFIIISVLVEDLLNMRAVEKVKTRSANIQVNNKISGSTGKFASRSSLRLACEQLSAFECNLRAFAS